MPENQITVGFTMNKKVRSNLGFNKKVRLNGYLPKRGLNFLALFVKIVKKIIGVIFNKNVRSNLKGPKMSYKTPKYL